jgi:hypothetical protein
VSRAKCPNRYGLNTFWDAGAGGVVCGSVGVEVRGLSSAALLLSEAGWFLGQFSGPETVVLSNFPTTLVPITLISEPGSNRARSSSFACLILRYRTAVLNLSCFFERVRADRLT